MTIWQAVVLGIVQGLTEFLPVSSSGHLIIVSDFLRWPEPSTFFAIALHWGTLLAVIIYFARDWLRIITKDRDVLWSIVVATVVTGAIAYGVADAREGWDTPWLTAGMLAGFGLLLWVVDLRARTNSRKIPSLRESVWLGVAQAMALVPGVSRSGAVITAARGLKMGRVEATRYAFLLSAPVIALSPLVLLTDLVPGDTVTAAVVVGFAAAFVSGWLAIAWLMKLVKQVSFGWFAAYRLALAALILILLH